MPDLTSFLNSPVIWAAVSAMAAVVSVYFARRHYVGRLVIYWRLREDGLPTIDVVCRNIGGGPVRNVEIMRDRDGFRSMILSELPPGAEYCIDTLTGRDSAREYSAVCGRLLWLRKKIWKTRCFIDPSRFSGVRLRGKTALREIADTLGGIETRIRDSPALQNIGHTVAISRPNRQEWILPRGVLAVLLPRDSEMRRTDWQDETKSSDDVRQMRPSGSSAGSHVPQDVMRVVFDPEVLSREDEKKLNEYLEHGVVSLHLKRTDRPISQFLVVGSIGGYRETRVIERRVIHKELE